MDADIHHFGFFLLFLPRKFKIKPPHCGSSRQQFIAFGKKKTLNSEGRGVWVCVCENSFLSLIGSYFGATLVVINFLCLILVLNKILPTC